MAYEWVKVLLEVHKKIQAYLVWAGRGAAAQCAALCDDGAAEGGWGSTHQRRAADEDAQHSADHHRRLALGRSEASRDRRA